MIKTSRLFRKLPAVACVAGIFYVSVQAVAQDQSVAYQQNVRHDGFDSASSLVPSLTLKWRHNFASRDTVSYPLIAEGRVFVTVARANFTKALVALDEITGDTIWSVNVGGTYSYVNAAYDSGKVFAINFDGLLKAFDAATGNLLWSVDLPIQYAFTSPPTATGGIVYVGGAGSGGTLYAVDEINGALLWSAGVANGDSSSPCVAGGRVFVSYVCPQSYAFDAITGQLLWHYSGDCEGGGGATAVAHAGKVYVRDVFFEDTNGLILDAASGSVLGGFDSDTAPAFVRNTGLYLQSGTLRAVDLRTGQIRWSFAGDGTLISNPIVVNRTIYIGGSSGMLFGLDFSGQQIWTTQVGAPITGSNEGSTLPTTGFGAGDGLLVVPAGSVIAAYGN
jgi:outer membrane protein assembly factor BamB